MPVTSSSSLIARDLPPIADGLRVGMFPLPWSRGPSSSGGPALSSRCRPRPAVVPLVSHENSVRPCSVDRPLPEGGGCPAFIVTSRPKATKSVPHVKDRPADESRRGGWELCRSESRLAPQSELELAGERIRKQAVPIGPSWPLQLDTSETPEYPAPTFQKRTHLPRFCRAQDTVPRRRWP